MKAARWPEVAGVSHPARNTSPTWLFSGWPAAAVMGRDRSRHASGPAMLVDDEF
jgi:hypothetical protein